MTFGLFNNTAYHTSLPQSTKWNLTERNVKAAAPVRHKPVLTLQHTDNKLLTLQKVIKLCSQLYKTAAGTQGDCKVCRHKHPPAILTDEPCFIYTKQPVPLWSLLFSPPTAVIHITSHPRCVGCTWIKQLFFSFLPKIWTWSRLSWWSWTSFTKVPKPLNF